VTNVVEGSVEGGKASGYVAPGFEGVRAAFEDNFVTHGEVGAAVAVYVEGRKVVDLWGGTADDQAGTPYTEDTLQLVFSTTKGITALCANVLAQRGLLDVDAPVAEYWPEFAAAGKADVPVKWLLSHQVGLPYVDADLSLEQVLAWDPVVEALAAQAPLWEPGTGHGYHAVTYGWLVGEVIGRPHLGVPGLLSQEGMFNRPEVRAAELPAANGVTNARSLAKLFAATIGEVDQDGTAVGPLLTPEQTAAAIAVQSSGPDKVLMFETVFGLGYMLSSPFSPYGGARGFGHSGAGGSMAFADPDAGVAFGYVMNRMLANLAGDPRTTGLVRAVYDTIGVTPTFV